MEYLSWGCDEAKILPITVAVRGEYDVQTYRKYWFFEAGEHYETKEAELKNQFETASYLCIMYNPVILIAVERYASQ